VNLTATSPNGCFHDTSTTVEVYSYIKADFSVSNVQGCSPLTVEIDDTSKGIVDHYWFWDAENNPTIGSHDSLNPGNSFTKTYVNRTGLIQEKYLTLVIENSQNCRDTLHRKITIYPEVTAEFTPLNQAGCNPFTVDFTNQSHYTDTTSDNGLAYNWDFGDGGSSNQAGPIHVFNNTLPTDTNYTVKMTVTSPNGCLDSTETNVSVYDYIKADFSVSNPVGCAPYTITIDEYSSGGVDSYEWYWDDDYTSVDSANVTGTFTHTYQNTTTSPVNYTLTLVVENNNNCTDTLRRNITVYPQVIADFTPTLTEGCHPVSVHFNNTTTITNPPNYTWNFGDGGSSNLEEPDHTFYNFSNTGDSTYTVELIAVSDYYCADTTTRTIDVYHNPKAQIDINQTEDCPPLEIIANNTSTGADSYEWHFGDGDVENYNNPVTVNHSYDNTTSDVESFTLKLITETTNNCLDSTQLQLSVYPRVEAEFDVVGGNWAGCHPFSVQFVDSSENANYYYWDFKDGVTSNLQNPVNRFENTTQTNKDYEVFLRATSDFDCVDSIDHTITVYPSPTAAFAVTPTLQIFPNATVSIDNNTNQGPWNYSWTFGDGQSSNQDEPGLHTYQTWGEYEISLLAQSANCEDSVDHSISIIPPEPQAAFQMSPQEGCEPLTVQFTDNSLYAEDYYWDFDDGSPVSNEVNPTHTFTEAGTYYVKQTIEGEGGEDYAYNTIRVYQKPEADFTVEPKLVMLPDQEIHCYNLSKYEHYYLWNFGDGATANEEDPIHLYRDEGIYDIRLEIETIEGCKDTLVKYDIVEVVGQGELEFPDAFTPSKSGPSNGEWKENDLSNDIFHPIGKGVVEYKLYIYNKWGEQLFMSDDFKIGWDGYYNGELMPQDVYIWKAEGKFSNGKTFERMGNVTLLR
jgi:gliding motility-associated-like protein